MQPDGGIPAMTGTVLSTFTSTDFELSLFPALSTAEYVTVVNPSAAIGTEAGLVLLTGPDVWAAERE